MSSKVSSPANRKGEVIRPPEPLQTFINLVTDPKLQYAFSTPSGKRSSPNQGGRFKEIMGYSENNA